jgi:hypothetical protein
MKSEIKDKYAVATVVSIFRQRYVIPVEKLQALNEDHDLDEADALVWLEECVQAEQVKEFSQAFLGQQTVESGLVDRDTMLSIFDKDNDYLVKGPDGWSEEKKLAFIDNWEEIPPKS